MSVKEFAHARAERERKQDARKGFAYREWPRRGQLESKDPGLKAHNANPRGRLRIWAISASLAKEGRKTGQNRRSLMYDMEAPAVPRRTCKEYTLCE